MTTPRAEHPAPIALQMWTLHERASQDLLGVVGEVASVGYVGVEIYDLYGQAPKTVRARLPYGEGVVDIDAVVRRDCYDYLVGHGLGSGKVAA